MTVYASPSELTLTKRSPSTPLSSDLHSQGSPRHTRMSNVLDPILQFKITNCILKQFVLPGAASSPVWDGHRAFALSTNDERGEYFGYGRPDRKKRQPHDRVGNTQIHTYDGDLPRHNVRNGSDPRHAHDKGHWVEFLEEAGTRAASALWVSSPEIFWNRHNPI